MSLAVPILSYNYAISNLYRYSTTWPGSSHKDLKERFRYISYSSCIAMTVYSPNS